MLNSGITGTTLLSFRSKSEALKYSIETTTEFDHTGKKINYQSAKELYQFICDTLELPDVYDDGTAKLFNSLNETLEEAKISKRTAALPQEPFPLATPGENIDTIRDYLKAYAFTPRDGQADSDGNYKESFYKDTDTHTYKVTIEKYIHPIPAY